MIIKIKVPEDNFNLTLPVPLSLFINRLTCPLIANYVNKYAEGIKLDSKQLYQLFKCLNDSKKVFGHYDLVNIESSEGEIILIKM